MSIEADLPSVQYFLYYPIYFFVQIYISFILFISFIFFKNIFLLFEMLFVIIRLVTQDQFCSESTYLGK